MLDSFGRKIDYVRVSVTDRCDLRCVYCMPEDGVPSMERSEVLSYEEILRLVRLLSRLGVKKVRLTGGEPLVRRDLPALVEQLKRVDGIERVVLTTNGVLLSEQLSDLVSAGLDGVNISIDAVSEDVFRKITRRGGVEKVLRSIDAALACERLTVKLNCVPTLLNQGEIIPMAERFLTDSRLSLRFIEMMPIGLGKTVTGIPERELMTMLTERFGELSPLPREKLAGPCRYYGARELAGRLGFISAVSDCFCDSCNRVRLTAGGFLKTCLQYDRGVELKPLMASGDEVIIDAMKAAIWEKPERHFFAEQGGAHLERHIMSQIGG